MISYLRLADHSPLLIEIDTRYKPIFWKLNTFDLQDKEFVDDTKCLLEEVFEINISSFKY